MKDWLSILEKLTPRPMQCPMSVDPTTLETEVGGYSKSKN